jgi:hypothetical protein
MSSLIQNATSLGITYNASSLTVYSSHKPENVFINDDSSYFHSSGSPSNQWWQVSFSKPVEISSYIIRTKTEYSHHPIRWYAETSFDGLSWRIVDIKEKDVGGNREIFYPYEPFNCFHFRIVLKRNSNNDNYLIFAFFDCFGKLGKNETKRVLYYCNTLNTQNSLSMQILVSPFMLFSH